MNIAVKRNPAYMHIYNLYVDSKRLYGAIRGRGKANIAAKMMGEALRIAGVSVRVMTCEDRRFEC